MLKGENIYLRALEPSDLEFLYQCENDVTVWGVTNTHQPFSKDTLQKYMDNIGDIYSDKQLRLVICKNVDNNPIGCVDFFDFEPLHKRAGIGILILSDERGKGYAKEALEITNAYAKSGLLIHQVYANVESNNEKSLQLFKTSGFKECGVKEKWNRTSKGWNDEIMLQLIFD